MAADREGVIPADAEVEEGVLFVQTGAFVATPCCGWAAREAIATAAGN